MRLKVSDVCQLLDKSKYNLPHTKSGLTFTAGTDGSIIVNGTCTSTVWANISSFELNPEHTFILIGCPGTNVNDVALYTLDPVENDTKQWEEGTGSLATGNRYKHKNNELWIRILAGYVCNNLTFKPQLFDLTEMYGAGNEPTTVAQFRQDFPNEMYDYSPECWKRFKELRYRTETKNLFDISKADIIQHNGYWTSNADFTEHFYTQIVEPGKTYIASYECYNPLAGNDSLSLGVQTGNGFGDGATLHVGLIGDAKYKWVKQYSEFIIPNGITQVTFSAFTETMFRNLQIEEGSTATSYQPYGYLPLRRGKFVANKEPVQLLPISDKEDGVNAGVTFTNNHNGTWTADLCEYNLLNAVSFH